MLSSARGYAASGDNGSVDAIGAYHLGVHICLISHNDFVSDPRSHVVHHHLLRAGHRVSIVASGRSERRDDDIHWVPIGRPAGLGPVGAVIRRLRSSSGRRRVKNEALAAAAIETGADLFHVLHRSVAGAGDIAATATGGFVVRWPDMPATGDTDLVAAAPRHPLANPPVAGGGTAHTPEDDRAPYTPEPGRHAGTRLALCYRKTDSNPGKYLEAALERAGITVDLHIDSIDFDHLAPGTNGVIFVEGPYPAIDVSGTTPDVPIVFWAHHGEHHLFANLRLAERYRADAVLLAHSWHMAHWFPVPVHRFPFGVATELLDPSRPVADRSFDVAMVGAKLFGSAGPYGRRQQIVASLSEAFPSHRLGFAEKVSADEMAALYADARIVVNEGGTRHYPITMRVLEAVGSGAVLLTDDLPGTDLILRRHDHYAVLGADVVSDVRHLIADLGRLQKMADSARSHALGLHTYDHRVDELLRILESSDKHDWPPTRAAGPLAEAIDRDAEVQRIAHVGAPELADELAGREIWDASSIDRRRLAPGKMETVALRVPDIAPHLDVVRAARRFAYFDGRPDGLDTYLDEEQPQAGVTVRGPITRVDLMAESYRVMPHEKIHP